MSLRKIFAHNNTSTKASTETIADRSKRLSFLGLFNRSTSGLSSRAAAPMLTAITITQPNLDKSDNVSENNSQIIEEEIQMSEMISELPKLVDSLPLELKLSEKTPDLTNIPYSKSEARGLLLSGTIQYPSQFKLRLIMHSDADLNDFTQELAQQSSNTSDNNNEVIEDQEEFHYRLKQTTLLCCSNQIIKLHDELIQLNFIEKLNRINADISAQEVEKNHAMSSLVITPNNRTYFSRLNIGTWQVKLKPKQSNEVSASEINLEVKELIDLYNASAKNVNAIIAEEYDETKRIDSLGQELDKLADIYHQLDIIYGLLTNTIKRAEENLKHVTNEVRNIKRAINDQNPSVIPSSPKTKENGASLNGESELNNNGCFSFSCFRC